MSQQGKDSRRTKEEERARLEVDLQQAETTKNEKQQAKEEAESPEKEALERHRQLEDEKRRQEEEEEKSRTMNEAENLYNLLDSNEDGVISIDEIKTRQTFDRNKDGVVSDEEALFFLNMENEMTKEEFLKTGWIVVKPYFMMESGMFKPPEPEKTEETAEAETPESQTLDADEQTDNHEDYEDDELEDMEKPATPNLQNEEEGAEDEEKDDEIKIQNDLYDEATRALIQSMYLCKLIVVYVESFKMLASCFSCRHSTAGISRSREDRARYQKEIGGTK